MKQTLLFFFALICSVTLSPQTLLAKEQILTSCGISTNAATRQYQTMADTSIIETSDGVIAIANDSNNTTEATILSDKYEINLKHLSLNLPNGVTAKLEGYDLERVNEEIQGLAIPIAILEGPSTQPGGGSDEDGHHQRSEGENCLVLRITINVDNFVEDGLVRINFETSCGILTLGFDTDRMRWWVGFSFH